MPAEPRAMPGLFRGLSAKLIAVIILVILAVEVIVFLPSLANFRNSWLSDRLRVGVVAARVLDAVPDLMALPKPIAERLLKSAEVIAIVYRRDGQSQLIALEDTVLPKETMLADLRESDPVGAVTGALDTLIFGKNRVLRIVGEADGAEGNVVEVLMPEAPLRADMLVNMRDFAFLSLLIAAMTAVVIYVLLSRLLIDPIRRITANMVAYRQAPENAALIIAPSQRGDEIGVVEQELAAMETDLFSMLRQRRHLADLGLAVAKINHDLRNTLTSAQLLSDQVANLDDPKVQRLAPRLVNTLDKAIGFAQSVLDHGRESATPPRPVAVDLQKLVEDSFFDAGLVAHPEIRSENAVPAGTRISVDPDQFGRVLVNLLKNARQALEATGGKIEAPAVRVTFAAGETESIVSVIDNGPGLPPRARENLFVAFEGSARAGGTGLGLAIARELVEAHGGRLSLNDQEKGTRFDIALPVTLMLSGG